MDAPPQAKRSKSSPDPLKSAIGEECSDQTGQSSFEQLPVEIVWAIIDYAPQTVFTLRLVSQLLKTRVNDYALQRSNVVEMLKISDQVFGFNRICTAYRLRRQNIIIEETEEDDPAEIRFRIEIYHGMEQVFELRVKLLTLKPPFDLKKLIKFRGPHNKKVGNAEERDSGLKYLGQCMGRHIGCVDYGLGSPVSEFPLVGSLLEGTQFRQAILKINFTISTDLSDRISQFVKLHGVDDICMIVNKIDHSVDSVKMLLDLSSYVRNLHINQKKLDEIDSSRNYFLGVFDVDWGKIMLEMFSNKLQYLNIFNVFYVSYLSKEGADSLIKELPLMNKKICFWTSCKQYYGKTLEYSKNDYCIRVSYPQNEMCTLSIIHNSRRLEKQGMF